MKKRLAELGIALALTFPLGALACCEKEGKAECHADQKHGKDGLGEMTPEKKEMMAKWMAYATPGAPHEIFKGMVGKWTYTSQWWEKSDGEPQKSKGTSTLKLILGGKFLQHEVKGKSMGMPFEGLGITGYDNIKKSYDTIWLDSMGTGVMHGIGSYDASTQTISDKGTASCPMSASGAMSFRSDWKVIDKNHMSYTMFGPGKEGKEFKQMELQFTRKK
jgi:hypothetical protein